jgi:ABC-type branched-subunit amino acid transport system ATPase component
MNMIETSRSGKRYRGTWALRECTMTIPAGYVAALVGPNGAGKSTPLNMAVGLAAPSAGAVDQLPAGQPVLAFPVDRGRLAARAVPAPYRGDDLARPPPRGLNTPFAPLCTPIPPEEQ